MTGPAPLLLFVCTGNICRSPMAEVIAREEARIRSVDIRIESAGTSAMLGNPAHEYARDAVRSFGLSLAPHRAKSLTRELVADAALVLAVTRRHRDDLRHFFPRHARKIVSFDDVTGLGDLDDPFGGGAADFETTAALLRKGMPSVLKALESH
jgi:protein-tyrosine-phosphatase